MFLVIGDIVCPWWHIRSELERVIKRRVTQNAPHDEVSPGGKLLAFSKMISHNIPFVSSLNVVTPPTHPEKTWCALKRSTFTFGWNITNFRWSTSDDKCNVGQMKVIANTREMLQPHDQLYQKRIHIYIYIYIYIEVNGNAGNKCAKLKYMQFTK